MHDSSPCCNRAQALEDTSCARLSFLDEPVSNMSITQITLRKLMKELNLVLSMMQFNFDRDGRIFWHNEDALNELENAWRLDITSMTL
jgi:hypothetical protein